MKNIFSSVVDPKAQAAVFEGIKLEKMGNIDGAIKNYEKAIYLNFDGNHPYDRLAILYRKSGNIKEEIRVLEKGISVFSDLERSSPRKDIPIKLNKFKSRLEKAKLKLK